ncbi:transposase [Streptomyces sp. NPDC050535]|uniref:transposase n=1 Tax=Streptomyces sp. NPDC050535 TaxID=3365626 RepID=UPI00378EE4F7
MRPPTPPRARWTGRFSCPEWADEPVRRRAVGVPEEASHVPNPRLALGLLDQLATSLKRVPVIVADAG